MSGIYNTQLIAINPENPDPEHIRIAARTIREGGVVVFPTQCLYGLGADARNAEAVARIFAIKRRASSNPLLILIQDRKDLTYLTDVVSLTAVTLMDAFWPGNITFLFEAKASLPEGLTAGDGKIGVRLPGHPVARRLVLEAGGPITGTSANLSGFPGCARISELVADIARNVDLILDAGPLKGGIGSTIVDVTENPPVIVREGIIPAERIYQALSKPMLRSNAVRRSF
ncbi:MAG: L-threonylcarbamoyladenylate synthase [Pseudomonadota bacterium]